MPRSRPSRPWVGVHVSGAQKRLYVTGVTTDGPGMQAGDVDRGGAVETLSDLYGQFWDAGGPVSKFAIRCYATTMSTPG